MAIPGSALLFYERHLELLLLLLLLFRVVVVVVAIVNVLATTNGDQSASVPPSMFGLSFAVSFDSLISFFFPLLCICVSIFSMFFFNLVPGQVASLWARLQ